MTLQRPPDAPGQGAGGSPRPLFYWPDYRANPYQRLLYAALDRLGGGRLASLPGTVRTARAAQAGRDRGAPPAIFHLHWEDAIFAGHAEESGAAAGVAGALAELERFAGLGGRLVWTVHNDGGHERRFTGVERRLRRGLGTLATVVHVHNRATLSALTDELGALPRAPVIVPHPAYDALPAVADRLAAADPWRPGTVVRFVHAGKLRPYKGIDLLLAAWEGLHAEGAVLTIAGHPDMPLPAPAPGLTLLPRSLEDHELAAQLAAADFAVLPYRRVATSGSLLLALSLGLPAIVPDLPAMAELVTDGGNGFLFRREDARDLRRVMRQAMATAPEQRAAMREAARAVVLPLGWDALAPRFFEIITGGVPAGAGFAGAPPAAEGR